MLYQFFVPGYQFFKIFMLPEEVAWDEDIECRIKLGTLLQRILHHIKFISVYYRGLPVGVRPFKPSGVIGVDMAVDKEFRFILVKQRKKSGKPLVGEVGQIVYLIGGGVGDQNVEASMPPQFKGQLLYPEPHLQFCVLIGSAGDVLHGAAQTQNTDAPIDKDIVFDAGTAFGRITVKILVVISFYIEKGDIAEGHKKTQILLRQIAAGDNEVDIFHSFRIVIVVEKLRLLIRKYHNF